MADSVDVWIQTCNKFTGTSWYHCHTRSQQSLIFWKELLYRSVYWWQKQNVIPHILKHFVCRRQNFRIFKFTSGKKIVNCNLHPKKKKKHSPQTQIDKIFFRGKLNTSFFLKNNKIFSKLTKFYHLNERKKMREKKLGDKKNWDWRK